MPTQLRSNKERGEEEREKDIDNNLCGICRALGFPICKGHGKKASGGDESSDNDLSSMLNHV